MSSWKSFKTIDYTAKKFAVEILNGKPHFLSHKQPAQFKEFEGITSNKLLENVDYVMNRSF